MKEKTKRYIIAYLLMPLLLFFLWFVVGLLVNLWLIIQGDELDISFLFFTIMVGVFFASLIFICNYAIDFPNINIKET